VIKIGLVAPFEGRYRHVGYDAVYAARLAVRELNAAAQPGEWRFELVAYDDRADPALARDAARNLIVDPDVVAVIGHYRRETTAVAAPLYAEADVPLIAIGAGITPTSGVHQLWPDPEAIAETIFMMDVMASSKTQTVDVWGADEPLGRALTKQLPTWAERPKDRGRPDLVLSALPAAETASRLAAWRAEGWTGAVVGGPALAAPTFGDVVGVEAAEGTCFWTPYPFPQDLPGLEAWRAAYEELGPHVPTPGPYALPTYVAAQLLAATVEAHVPVEHPSPRAQLSRSFAPAGTQSPLGEISGTVAGRWDAPILHHYCWRKGVPEWVKQVPPAP
jgi:ABC-type branched-subunit amino acid transport system substrate-binding protein